MKMKLGCVLPLMCMILTCYIICYSLLVGHCYGVVEEAKTLKSKEDLEIEQKFKLINKPAVKIIKSISGERYRCVDFYKQPGLDHSSMKNHTFHPKMRLMSYPEGLQIKRQTHSNKTFSHFWKNSVGCPIGTVPILQVTKDTLLKMKSLNGDNYNPQSSWSKTYKSTSSNGRHHFAVLRTLKEKTRRYNGAYMNTNAFNPLVGPTQFSSTRMHFQIGNEFIQVGWTVHPALYHDFNSRLFVYTNAGGRACYNTLCPDGFGMILVGQDLIPGRLTEHRDLNFAIIKDKDNGNWWLLMGTGILWEKIGVWPAKRFKESFGTEIEWGGEVHSPSSPSPPMGNSHYPKGTPRLDSYVRLITTWDENYNADNFVKNTERYSDGCYKVGDTIYMQDSWRNVGHLIVYGGPKCN
ncbi:putative neprosin [Arabidopsis thaliana]